MCIILLHLHIGGVALIGPVSDWLAETLPEPDADSPEACPEPETVKPSEKTDHDVQMRTRINY